VLIFAVAMLLVDKVGVRLMHDWYRSPTLLLNVVLVAALLPRRTRLARPLVLALVALVLYRVGQRALPAAREPLSAVVEAADRLRALPAGQRIGSWNAGALGYLSDRGVVGLDGLVNDAAFYREVVVPGRIASYLERERIHWLADVTFDDGSLAPLRRYGEAERAAVEAAYTPRAYLRGACARSCLAVALFERTVP
jgi:hypothetical protein